MTVVLSILAVVSAVDVSILSPADGGAFDGNWLTLGAIVENDNLLPDSVVFSLNGGAWILLPRLGTDWYTYMGNDLHTGFSESPAPHDATILWTAPVTGTVHEFPNPVIVDGIVYYPSCAGTGSLYAIDCETGETVWTCPVEAQMSFSTPAVTDGIMYIAALDGNLYAFGTGYKFSYEAHLDARTSWKELIVEAYCPGGTVHADRVLFLVDPSGREAASALPESEEHSSPVPDATRMNAFGGSVGIPHFVAVQYERLLGPDLALDLHAGTVILLNSFGARLALGSTADGFRPRLSMGIVASNMNGPFQEDSDDSKTVLFSWPGAGIAMRTAGISAAFDFGWLFSTSHETGWAANSYPAASLSVMARF